MKTYNIYEENMEMQKVIAEANSNIPAERYSGAYTLYEPTTLANTIKQEEARNELLAWINSVKTA